jgi:hypothetical protein
LFTGSFHSLHPHFGLFGPSGPPLPAPLGGRPMS